MHSWCTPNSNIYSFCLLTKEMIRVLNVKIFKLFVHKVTRHCLGVRLLFIVFLMTQSQYSNVSTFHFATLTKEVVEKAMVKIESKQVLRHH